MNETRTTVILDAERGLVANVYFFGDCGTGHNIVSTELTIYEPGSQGITLELCTVIGREGADADLEKQIKVFDNLIAELENAKVWIKTLATDKIHGDIKF